MSGYRSVLALAVPLLSLLLACDGDPFRVAVSTGEIDIRVGLDLEVVAPAFRVGEIAQARLRNDTDGTVFYGYCESMVEERRGDEWVSLPSLRFCPGGFSELEADGTVDLALPLEQAGTFRYRLPVKRSRLSATEYLLSEPFVVSPA